jgi:hypothetical protein
MDEIAELQTLGLAWPSPAYIVGVVLFSIVGFVAYRFGKKAAEPTTKWLGVALMLYPYVVSNTWGLYAVGAALCAAVYLSRR